MSGIRRFEDIESWQRARDLCGKLYAITECGAFSRDFGLSDQIRKAAISVMSNIAEGFDRVGNREFIYFLSIAKGSTAEIQAQLYIALDAQHIATRQFEELYQCAKDIGNLIGGLIRYLKQSNKRGVKFDSA